MGHIYRKRGINRQRKEKNTIKGLERRKMKEGKTERKDIFGREE
ncbi:MAG: hypothetical protein QW482_04915 [Thermoproteota archaeon]